MGLRMPEPLARKIKELSKGLPADFTYRRIAKAVSNPRFEQLPDGSKTDVSMVTTDDVDREGEIILPGGIDLTDFRRSPTVFYNHDYAQPIGKALWINPEANGLAAMTKYAKKPADWQGPWLPDAVHSMMQEGIGCGKSIGLIPLHMRPLARQDIEKRPDWKGADHIVDKGILLEFSAAPLPVNQNALSMAVSKGIITREGILALGIESLAFTKKPSATNPTERMSKYAHIDFKPTKEVQKAHKEGIQRHEAGESRGLATPETLAMAKHLADGGEASPEYVRKAAEYHETNPHHATAKPGTPALCLALLHGGRAGAEHYKAIRKAMDDTDASPSTMIDENNAPPAVTEAITKSAGANENNTADGGAAVPVQEPADVVIPCPDCKSGDFVDARGIDPVKGKMYECGMCGKSFSEKELPAPSTDADEDDVIKAAKTKAVKTKAEGTVVVNHDTAARAASLIDHGHYTEDKWDAPNGGDRKPEDCLGKREGESVESAEKNVCPIIQNGQVYVHAVADAESRESGTAVGEAAAALMRKIQAHRESSAKTKSLSLTPEQIQKAVERELKSREPEILKKAMEIANDRVILAMGGV